MLVICPKCQAENEDIARFCNQCGSALDNSLPEIRPVAVAPEFSRDDRRSGVVNWSGLIIIAAVIAAIWYVAGRPSQPGMNAGAGGGGAAAMPQEVLDSIAADKAVLRDDPANLAALSRLYETYGMVGKTAEVTPYAEAALDHLIKNRETYPDEEYSDRLLGLFSTSYTNRDDAVCLSVLQEYHKQFPDNLRIIKVLGDLSYDALLFDQAALYYSEYLDRADPADDPENYLKAMTDLASCYLQQGISDNGDPEMIELTLTTLDRVFALDPDFWQAHFNRGVALSRLERMDEAVGEWTWCVDNAEDEMQKWRAQYAIAELRGEDPPPMPASPHMEGFGGMHNPHGEGMMAPPLDGSNLPPNPHSEEFLQQHSQQPETDPESDG